MGLYRRNNGVYYLNKTINKHTYRLSLETKNYHEAKERYEMFCSKLFYNRMHNIREIPLIMRESDFKQSKAHHGEIDRPSLEKVCKDHIKISKHNGITKETIQVKKLVLTVFKRFNLEWDTINHDTILDIQITLRQEYSKTYVCKIVTNMRSILNYAIKQGYYDYNDYKRIKFMKRPPRTSVKTKISDRDLKKILNYLVEDHDIDFLNLILTLLITVSRPSEIIKLTRKNLDFDNELIHVFQYKTKQSKPSPVPKHILNNLMQLMKINDSVEGYIFHGASRNKEFYSNKFKVMREKLNLNPEYTLQKLRHTGICHVANEFGIATAQQMAGHSNIKITLEHYYSPDLENTRKASENIVNKLFQR